MFYSEKLQSPISSTNVRLLFGIDPVAEPEKALKASIYQVIDCPDGYSCTHYVKENQVYRAVPSDVSNAEKELIYRVRATKMTIEEAADNLKLPDTTDLVED